MKDPYLNQDQMKAAENLMEYIAEDTILCWIATRINGSSPSMASEGNISFVLLKELDKRILPLIKE